MGEKIDLRLTLQKSGVVDSGCLSRIPDPATGSKEMGEKICHPEFFLDVVTNITKLKIILFLNR
jgi:hypothetical protein